MGRPILFLTPFSCMLRWGTVETNVCFQLAVSLCQTPPWQNCTSSTNSLAGKRLMYINHTKTDLDANLLGNKKKSALPVHSQKYTYTEIKKVSFACPLTKRYLLGNKKFSFACSLTKQIQLYICRKLTEQMLPLCEHVILIKQCQRQKYFARQCINFLTGSQK